MKNRVFVDTNILIAGADSRSGASHAVLVMAEIDLYTLVVSRQVLDETERNLRKKLPRALPVFVELMTHLNLEIIPDPEPSECARWEAIIEAKDAPILAAAILAGVDRLVTLNTKDFTTDVAEQIGLLIQTPAELIHEVRAIVDREL